MGASRLSTKHTFSRWFSSDGPPRRLHRSALQGAGFLSSSRDRHRSESPRRFWHPSRAAAAFDDAADHRRRRRAGPRRHEGSLPRSFPRIPLWVAFRRSTGALRVEGRYGDRAHLAFYEGGSSARPAPPCPWRRGGGRAPPPPAKTKAEPAPAAPPAAQPSAAHGGDEGRIVQTA